MKLTKYEHACIVLEEQGKRLVIDPGSFTPDFGPLDNIAAVVVTHNHPDHFNTDHLDAIIAANPDVVVHTTPQIVTEWGNTHAQAVHAYDDFTNGPFTLRFFGETHAEIHQGFPRPQNTGVLVNNAFYYPGDSLTPPDHDVTVLAAPASAPWLKASESIDFIQAICPKQCIPTHTALLSDVGKAITYRYLEETTKSCGGTFHALAPGQSLEF